MFVEMMKEVEGWGRDCYEGLTVSPGAEKVQYEMMQLVRVWCVCWKVNPAADHCTKREHYHYDTP